MKPFALIHGASNYLRAMVSPISEFFTKESAYDTIEAKQKVALFIRFFFLFCFYYIKMIYKKKMRRR